MRKIMLGAAVAAGLLLSACSDPDNARRVVEDHGFTNIEITGYRWTGCSDKDTWHTGFRATSPAGRRVTGVVCSSGLIWGKSNTLRLD